MNGESAASDTATIEVEAVEHIETEADQRIRRRRVAVALVALAVVAVAADRAWSEVGR